MDSLLASYASSDEEEAATRPPLPPPSLRSTTTTTISSLFSSLPPPTTNTTTTSLFSSLPLPKSGKAGKPDPSMSNSSPTKKVVFLKPLWSSSDLGSDDDDDDDAEKKAKAKEKESAQVPKSQTLSLPPPKHSFGLAPLPSSAGRRVVVDTDTSSPSEAISTKRESVSYGEKAASLGADGAAASDHGYFSSGCTTDGSSDPYSGVGSEVYGDCGDYNNQEKVQSTSYGEKAAALGVDGAAACDYGYYSSDPHCNVGGEGYGGYPQYGSGWGDEAMAAPAPLSNFFVGDGRRNKGKRGRDEVPSEVVEVNQDELVKNRPREDQTKMTGIAFGPAYQPVSSAKGKPSKLHKRKHQIGSLYFDMKQKEMELTERRARGLQTKTETQGKYGW